MLSMIQHHVKCFSPRMLLISPRLQLMADDFSQLVLAANKTHLHASSLEERALVQE